MVRLFARLTNATNVLLVLAEGANELPPPDCEICTGVATRCGAAWAVITVSFVAAQASNSDGSQRKNDFGMDCLWTQQIPFADAVSGLPVGMLERNVSLAEGNASRSG